METSSDDQREHDYKHLIITELTQGRELAKQLQIHLNIPSSSHENRELLIHKILNSYDKVLSMLKYSRNGNGNGLGGGDPQYTGMGIGRSESSRSFSGSPRSEDSDRDFKDSHHKDASRKRKSSMQRWSQQVRISPETGLEGSLDDGYSWRKYGQKDILGAKYPRGYYRCTHRIVQGCLATKQVQKSDDDPTILEITYLGRHTCTSGPHPNPPPPPPPEKQEPPVPPPQHNQSPEILLNFQTGLKFITQNLDTPDPDQSFPSFHFPSNSKGDVFSPSTNFPGNFSPSFISPATSGSTYFSMSPTRMSGFGGAPGFGASVSELNEIVSAATSATSSPTVGLGFTFGQMEFDQNFTFDNSRFFS